MAITKITNRVYDDINPVAFMDSYMERRFGPNWTANDDAGLAIKDFAAENPGRATLVFSNKSYKVDTLITSTESRGKTYLGSGFGTQIKSNINGPLFHFTGENGFTGGGVSNMVITLQDGFGVSNNCVAIKLDGNSVDQPSQLTFKSLYITATGNSYWYRAIDIIGTARTSPQGIRVIHAEDLQLFRSWDAALTIFNLVQGTIINVGSYVGTGTGNNILIGGGGTSSTNTVQVSIFGLACGGDLNVTNCSHVHLQGKCSTLSTGSSANYISGDLFRGSQSGTFGPNSIINLG